MRKELKEIQKKYGENIFRLAITHLIYVGIEQFSKMDIDAICEKARHDTPNNSIMTGEFQADILRCAHAICKYSVDDLLRYIKTDMNMEGIPPHIRFLVVFRENATNRLIMSCMLPPNADTDVMNELTSEIERLEDEYDELYGSLYGFDQHSAIEKAAENLNIPLEPIPYDKVIHF